jgi:hypothetical protein
LIDALPSFVPSSLTIVVIVMPGTSSRTIS